MIIFLIDGDEEDQSVDAKQVQHCLDRIPTDALVVEAEEDPLESSSQASVEYLLELVWEDVLEVEA